MKSSACFVSFAASLLALGTVVPATAAVTVGARDQIQLGGFFSQGYLYSSENNYPTASKDGTWDFREMAVNVSTTFGSHLRVGAQAFAQSFGQIGDDKVILDWAVADYNVSSYLGVRAGRIKYPKGLYGEALDLDVVRPFVFLPNAVYNPILRDFSASFDGAMIYGSASLGASSLDYKAFYGDIPISPRKGVAEFYNDAGLYAASGVTRLEMDSVLGGQLAWNTPLSGLKLVYSFSRYENLSSDGPFVAFAPANLHSNFERFDWHTASIEFVTGDWVFATEWQRADGPSFQYSAAPVLPLVEGTAGWDGWYVSAARRLNDRFEVGAYYGEVTSLYSTRPSSDPSTFQHDAAVSVRFDLNEHVLFKLEAHYIEGTYQTFDTARIPNPSAGLSDDNVVLAAKTTLSF